MDISEEALKNIAKNVTLKDWVPFAERITKTCEKETSAIMRHIKESDKCKYVKSPPENIALLKRVISKNMSIISQIESITKGLENAEKKGLIKASEISTTTESQ